MVTELIMDILRALSSANLDIRKKTLDITLDLVTPSTVAEVMQVLKKEVTKTAGEDGDKAAGEYRTMLISAIHKSTTKFPDAVSTVVPILMDFLGDANQVSAIDVILFVREIVETYPHLRDTIMRKLLQTFPVIHSARVYRACLWLVGEYCTEAQDVAMAFTTLKQSLGELPFATPPAEDDVPGTPTPPPPPAQGKPVILADGTYGHQSAMEDSGAKAAAPEAATSKLRGFIVGGDYFLATVVATALAKLALRSRAHVPPATANLVAADVMLILTGLLQLGTAGRGSTPIDADSQERIQIFLQVLSNPTEAMMQLVLVDCRQAFSVMLQEKLADAAAEAPKVDAASEVSRQSDDLISVRQLRGRAVDTMAIDLDDDDDTALNKATGAMQQEDFSQRLKRVTQLTGLSDPVYAEAYVTVHSYDVMLDLLVINQTDEPMLNLCLELATVGDLKLCERPQSYSLMPGEQKHVKANIKVSSTETGIVFGSIVYDAPSSATGGVAANTPSDRNCVVLNDIHIDIMDYIAPASTTDLNFRAMWAEFEWENKVAVNTDINDVYEFLQHIVKSTNMKCLTPATALRGHTDFLAANLYAKSIFGEDALVNVSVERRADSKICGYIRIRSKTQGIALSLGDKITLKQKTAPP